MKYYKNDLAPDLDDSVPTNSCDPATHQHMVTYSVSFGVTGELNPADYHSCLLDGSTPTWPNPTVNCDACPKKIDDLYHAAINGRGLFFSAADPQELIDSLKELMESIEARVSSGASATVNGEELGTNTVLYQSSYVSGAWRGDVTAYPVDPATGEVKRESEHVIWKAADQLQLQSWENRNIVTYNGLDSAYPFRFDYLTSAQKTGLDPAWPSDPTLAQSTVEYLRGREIEGFRARTKKLGDVVHSAPLLVGNTIFVGANDGMLHAFDAAYGNERFAYVPNLVFERLRFLRETNYHHLFFVDATPTAAVAVGSEDKAILIGGLGKGGKGYFALDITNADSVTGSTGETDVAEMVLWEYPRAGVGDDDLGYSYSKAYTVQSYATGNDWIVVFGNGYDSPNGHAVLYVLDLEGNILRKLDTGAGSCNGLSTPSLVDVDNDYRVDYAYAGDLKGNLWKFDLRDPDPANWAVAFSAGGIPQPLFQAVGQSITAKPDVMRHCVKHGYMVVFGTGRYLGDSDRGDDSVQTLYGIWDYGDDDDDDEYLGTFVRGASPQLANQPAHVELLEQTVADYRTIGGRRVLTLSGIPANWKTTVLTGGSCGAGEEGLEDCDPDGVGENPDPLAHAGWFFDLSLGEKGSSGKT